MRFRQSSQVAFRQIGDECLLVPIRTRPDEEMAVFRLNEVGAFLWKALARPATEEALCKLLATEFQVERGQARKDISAFIELLRTKDLIEPVTRK